MTEIEIAEGPNSDDSGRKQLTVENLLEADPASDVKINLSIIGLPLPRVPAWPERQRVILQRRLSDAVPRDVVSIFQAGQAAMAYAYYYYPLYELGCGHVFRAFERAVVIRAQREGCVEDKLMLNNALLYLTKRGVLSDEYRKRIDQLRRLRNECAHPKFQSYISPEMAMWALDDVAREIERLFGTYAE